MASKKNFKSTCDALEALGMSVATETRRGLIYKLGDYAVPVALDIADNSAKQVVHNAQKRLGAATLKDAKKRNPELIREREAAERDRLSADIARHQAEISDLVRQRDSRFNGLGQVLTNAELRDIERLIESKERDVRGWQRLMTELPSNNTHAGRLTAQHRS